MLEFGLTATFSVIVTPSLVILEIRTVDLQDEHKIAITQPTICDKSSARLVLSSMRVLYG